ncbi:MAG: hypothetical protein E7222_12840 [Clostridiales bacterium]|nr:hypothetical protein [Clostridiales bacterium]
MRKKNIFKKVKKDGHDFYFAPAELAQELNVTSFSLNGMFFHEPYCVSVLYSVEKISDTKLFTHFLSELRNLDVCIHLQTHKQNSDKLILAVYIFDAEVSAAYKHLRITDEKLKMMCDACKYVLTRYDFEKRMRYIYSEFMDGIQMVSNHLHPAPEKFLQEEDTSWIGDLCFDNRSDIDFYQDTQEQYDPYRSWFHSEKKDFYKICYIKKITSFKNPERYSTLFQNDCIRTMSAVIEPVSDYAQSIRYQATYLDHEVSYARLRRKKDARLKRITCFSEKEDSRSFILYGMIFVICEKSEDSLTQTFSVLKKEFAKCGLEIDELYGSELFTRCLSSIPAGLNLQNYPIRQAYSDQIRLASFSFYSYDGKEDDVKKMAFNEELTTEDIPENVSFADMFV